MTVLHPINRSHCLSSQPENVKPFSLNFSFYVFPFYSSPAYRLTPVVVDSILELITGFYPVQGPCKKDKSKDLLEVAEESNFDTSHSVLNEQVMMIDGYVPQINSLLLAHEPAEPFILLQYQIL